jgi:hypothetical protein
MTTRERIRVALDYTTPIGTRTEHILRAADWIASQQNRASETDGLIIEWKAHGVLCYWLGVAMLLQAEFESAVKRLATL